MFHVVKHRDGQRIGSACSGTESETFDEADAWAQGISEAHADDILAKAIDLTGGEYAVLTSAYSHVYYKVEEIPNS